MSMIAALASLAAILLVAFLMQWWLQQQHRRMTRQRRTVLGTSLDDSNRYSYHITLTPLEQNAASQLAGALECAIGLERLKMRSISVVIDTQEALATDSVAAAAKQNGFDLQFLDEVTE